MKRTTKIFASCMAAALLFGACTGKKTPEPERLTAEEILSLPSGYREADKIFDAQTLSDVWWFYDRDAALVKGTALSKNTIMGFSHWDVFHL